MNNRNDRVFLHPWLVLGAVSMVTRLNGYAGGYGTKARLGDEIDQLGLSLEGKMTLQKLVSK